MPSILTEAPPRLGISEEAWTLLSEFQRALVGRAWIPPPPETGVELTGGPAGWLALAVPMVAHRLPALEALAPDGVLTDGANVWWSEAALETLAGQWANAPAQALAWGRRCLEALADRSVGQQESIPLAGLAWVSPEKVKEALQDHTPLPPVHGRRPDSEGSDTWWNTPGETGALRQALRACGTRLASGGLSELSVPWKERIRRAAEWLNPESDGAHATPTWRLWERNTSRAALADWRHLLFENQPFSAEPEENGWALAMKALAREARFACAKSARDEWVRENRAFNPLVQALAGLPLGTLHQGDPSPAWRRWAERMKKDTRALAGPRFRSPGLSHRIRDILMAPVPAWSLAGLPPGLMVPQDATGAPRKRVAVADFELAAIRMAVAHGESLTSAAAFGSTPWVWRLLEASPPGSKEEERWLKEWEQDIRASGCSSGSERLVPWLEKQGRGHALARALGLPSAYPLPVPCDPSFLLRQALAPMDPHWHRDLTVAERLTLFDVAALVNPDLARGLSERPLEKLVSPENVGALWVLVERGVTDAQAILLYECSRQRDWDPGNEIEQGFLRALFLKGASIQREDPVFQATPGSFLEAGDRLWIERIEREVAAETHHQHLEDVLSLTDTMPPAPPVRF